jgi:hypothetical protein
MFNLYIKGTQYGGGQPKGIMMDWDIIQVDRRKKEGGNEKGNKDRNEERSKDKKKKRK